MICIISSEVIRGLIDIFILAILKDQMSYGYQISKEIEKRTNGLYVIKEATLYAAIKRLEAKELISSLVKTETQGRQRIYYQLTEQGQAFFMEKVVEWDTTKQIVDSLLKGDRE